MIDLAFLKRLIETVESSGIDTLEISRWGTRIRISKSPTVIGGESISLAAARTSTSNAASTNSGGNPQVEAEAPAEPAAEAATNLVDVVSPMVGTFYRAPAPDAEPYVEVGDRVSKGQTLCILEAMKLMNELEAEVDGTIKEINVANAEPVEYGKILFRILPD